VCEDFEPPEATPTASPSTTLEHLARLIDQVSGATSLDSVYERAVRCLEAALGIERAAILLFDGDGVMRFVAWSGLSARYRHAVEGHSPWTADVVDPAPVLVEDVERAPDLAPFADLFRSEGIGALAFVPLVVAGRLRGKFMLYHRAPHLFTGDEIAVARTAAAHVAFAIERLRVERELLDARQALSERLQIEKDLRRQAEAEVARRTQEMLETQESRLRLALEAGRMGAWDWDVESGRVRWSRELEEIHGLAPGTFSGTFEGSQRDVHAEDRDRVRAAIDEALARHGHYQVEYRIVLPTGDVRWVEARGKVLRSATGEASGMLGICSDVTERKRLERVQQMVADASSALSTTLDPDQTLKALARFVVDDSRAGAGLADYCVTYALEPDGTVRRAGLVHRVPAKQGLVEDLVQAGPPQLDDAAGVGAVLRTGEPLLASEITAERLERGAQNAEHLRCLRLLHPRSSIVVPLRARGRIVGAVALATTDDSGRRYTRDDLVLVETLAARAALLVDNARLYREAREAVSARDQTVAIVSHDLRDPLATICTGCTVLDMDPERALAAGTAGAMFRAAKQMERLVDDLLDVARIEAGGLSLELGPVDAAALVGDTAALFEAASGEKAMRLEVHVEDGLPPLRADRGRLSQVLSNLLGNAVKYVPLGGRVELRAEAVAPGGVRFMVRDSGPGIAPDQLPRLFDRFWQAERGQRGGAGLGLAIAKGIVEAHGGTLEVESALGRGSTFWFSLPVATAEPTSPTSALSAGASAFVAGDVPRAR
jgi:PAS domain S-box-containing protein